MREHSLFVAIVTVHPERSRFMSSTQAGEYWRDGAKP